MISYRETEDETKYQQQHRPLALLVIRSNSFFRALHTASQLACDVSYVVAAVVEVAEKATRGESSTFDPAHVSRVHVAR